MPPPYCPLVVLFVIVQFTTDMIPPASLKRPPPLPLEELYANVDPRTVRVPVFEMAPPATALFEEISQPSTLSVPALEIPPPLSRVPGRWTIAEGRKFPRRS